MSLLPENKLGISKCTYISKVAFHPLYDINAADSVLKNVNLWGKMWEAALNEKLYLDAQQEETGDHRHLKWKKLLMLSLQGGACEAKENTI